MTQQLNEDQIVEAIKKLSPEAWRNVIRKFLSGFEELDGIVDSNQERMRVLCRERGLDWDALSEKEREYLVDQIIHED